MAASKHASGIDGGILAGERLRHVLTMMACLIGDADGAFVHIVPPTRSKDSLLVLCLYPNANADINIVSATEREMLKVLKFENVAWVDLCTLSSRSTNAVINQRIVASFADDEELVRDYFRRFAEHLYADTNAMRCVYIAGGTCQAAFDKAIELKIVTCESRLSAAHDISIMSIGGKRFVVLEHAPHPSWYAPSAHSSGLPSSSLSVRVPPPLPVPVPGRRRTVAARAPLLGAATVFTVAGVSLSLCLSESSPAFGKNEWLVPLTGAISVTAGFLCICSVLPTDRRSPYIFCVLALVLVLTVVGFDSSSVLADASASCTAELSDCPRSHLKRTKFYFDLGVALVVTLRSLRVLVPALCYGPRHRMARISSMNTGWFALVSLTISLFMRDTLVNLQRASSHQTWQHGFVIRDCYNLLMSAVAMSPWGIRKAH
ncbi:hypothetical protein T492DRAFT_909867 [Pavlovales sp. CCMP2436]|nr:hypothetical protein T492DRAFT_909867 [Pavlovales sp. CCMP2436]